MVSLISLPLNAILLLLLLFLHVVVNNNNTVVQSFAPCRTISSSRNYPNKKNNDDHVKPKQNIFSSSLPNPSTVSSSLLVSTSSNNNHSNNNNDMEQIVDVVVIGAGIGGLTCGALSALYGYDTVIVEAHDTPGGVAHSFDRYSSSSTTTDTTTVHKQEDDDRRRHPFRFDSGPSLLSGISQKSTNPLRQVLDALNVADEIQWHTYDGWVVHDIADGQSMKLTTGDQGLWEDALEQKAGIESRRAFEEFRNIMLETGGLSEASTFIPPFALRGGYSTARTLRHYFIKLLSIGSKGTMLTGPFSKVMDQYNLTDPFVRKWFDYLAFALSGLDAAHTQAAPLAYTMIDLHRKGAVLDYPMGGMNSLIQALVSGLEKHGGRLHLNSRVVRTLLEDGYGKAECVGVVLEDGRIIKARKGVVCNAPIWNMARILEDSVEKKGTAIEAAVKEIREQANNMCMTGSFMHLHLGIPKDGLPEDLECHHSVLDFDKDITAEQNMVIISIPTVFDPSLAPDGYHIVHAYTAACDSFDEWETFLDNGVESGKVGSSPNAGVSASYRKDKRYQDLKDQKAEVLWKAIECVIPDIRERAARKGSVRLVGTPLTHRRYNQRYRGTYGPANSPGNDVWTLTGATTKIKGLLTCGDTCFPGIGLPGVASSGTIAANTMASVKDQLALMNKLRNNGALQ